MAVAEPTTTPPTPTTWPSPTLTRPDRRQKTEDSKDNQRKKEVCKTDSRVAATVRTIFTLTDRSLD